MHQVPQEGRQLYRNPVPSPLHSYLMILLLVRLSALLLFLFLFVCLWAQDRLRWVCGLSLPAQWLVSSFSEREMKREWKRGRAGKRGLQGVSVVCGWEFCGSRRAKLIYKHATIEGHISVRERGRGSSRAERVPHESPCQTCLTEDYRNNNNAHDNNSSSSNSSTTAAAATITNKWKPVRSALCSACHCCRRLLLLSLWQSK